MGSIEGSFTIAVNGQPVTKPEDNGDERIHAKTGGSEAAVFVLKDHHLESDDWYLGRFVIEDRSLMPKRVYWFKKGQTSIDQVQTTHAEKKGEGEYRLLIGGAPLVEKDGMLFAELLDSDAKPVKIQVQ